MRLGAQMFTVREQCKTPEEIEAALERIAQIGYQAVQVSGLGPIEPKRLKDCCDRLGLTIAVTHIHDCLLYTSEALRESICPRMGRDMVKSHFSLMSRPTPCPSEPMTRAVGPVKSVWHQGVPSISSA